MFHLYSLHLKKYFLGLISQSQVIISLNKIVEKSMNIYDIKLAPTKTRPGYVWLIVD